MKKAILLIFLFLPFYLLGQQAQIDSLKTELLKHHPDTSKTNLYLLLGQYQFDYDFEAAETTADSALYYGKKSNFRLAAIYNLLGVIASEQQEEERAREYFDKAIEQLDLKEDKTLRGIVYGNYSTTYDNSNNFEKELEYSLMAIALNKDNDSELCFLYYNHAVIYEDAGFHQEAMRYLNLSREVAERSSEIRVEAYAIKSLALFAIEDKELELADNYLERGIAICEESNSLEICHHMYFTLGRLQTEQGNYAAAEQSLLKAKDFAQQRNFETDIIGSEILLANLQYQAGNYEKAAEMFDRIDLDAYAIENIWFADLVYKRRSVAEQKSGNYRRSNELLQAYVNFADSLYLSKNRTLLAQADRKYQIEKKNKEIALQNNQIQKQSTRLIYLGGIAVFLLITALLIWLVYQQKQKRKNQELLALKREFQIKSLEALIEGEEKERFRIAKELHDGVNGDLSAIKFKLSSLIEMNNQVITEAITMIDDSCKQVRAISHNLVPPALENFSLLEAAQAYCESMDAAGEVAINFQAIGTERALPKKTEINILRIVQELVSNSVKHAKANEIDVQISYQENALQVTVEDDGIGFDKNEVANQGIGLSNIDSRIDYLNATVDFVSNKQGTSFTFEIDTTEFNEY